MILDLMEAATSAPPTITPRRIVTGFELMEFEPIVLHWRQRGVRHDWHSYVVIPQ